MTDRPKTPPASRPRHAGRPRNRLKISPRSFHRKGSGTAECDQCRSFLISKCSRPDLAPENRPVGVFLLLGPTGTGKTRTVEALAEALHGSIAKNLLKGRLRRVPDGARGGQADRRASWISGPSRKHSRCSRSRSSQRSRATRSALSLVLFDEIEKAAPSLTRLLLGVLDRGESYGWAIIPWSISKKAWSFLTSNLGR